MKVLLLAAGESSRTYPLNNHKHKTHIYLLGKSILQHAIESYLRYGYEVYVVSSPTYNLSNVLEEHILSKINIISQPRPLGVGDALQRFRDYADDMFFIANAYHLMDENLHHIVSSINEDTLFIKHTDQHWKYGMVEIKNGKIMDIEEKPEKWHTPYRVLGFYVLSKRFIDKYLAGKKGHYSFEHALKGMANKEGIAYKEYEHKTPSLKYVWDYYDYFLYLMNLKYPKNKIYGKRIDADTSKGSVVVEKDAEISTNAIIRGPAYIGKGTYVGDFSLVRESNIEHESIVGFGSEIARSILQEGSKVHGSYMGDSVVGRNFSSGFGYVSANRRLDRASISVFVKGRFVDSGKTSLGVFAGDNVSIGSNTTTMPGCVISSNSVLYPNIRVKGHVEGVIKYSNF